MSSYDRIINIYFQPLYWQKFIREVTSKDPFPAVNLCSGKSMELFRKSICWQGKLLDLIPELQVIEQSVHSDHAPQDGTEYNILITWLTPIEIYLHGRLVQRKKASSPYSDAIKVYKRFQADSDWRLISANQTVYQFKTRLSLSIVNDKIFRFRISIHWVRDQRTKTGSEPWPTKIWKSRTNSDRSVVGSGGLWIPGLG